MTQSYEPRLRRVLGYIHDTPAAGLSLEALAEATALSHFHFHRPFHAMTVETAV